ncbi:hypothetical protein [Deinococcus marmoris]|uniref:hypothetical protein n=1 Tax=Deinococcus marmoris TaxID=249408 RepID=UPI0004965C87|nr:hypothetical protein [Deinococcus marmoris]
MLDAIVCEEWSGRFFSFNNTWDEESQMASGRNGSGDEYFMLFRGGECVFKQFLHELEPCSETSEFLSAAEQAAPLSSGLLTAFIGEPAFSAGEISQLAWYGLDSQKWFDLQPVPIPKADSLLPMILSGSSAQYIAWANDYFEADLSQVAVQAIFEFAPLTAELVNRVNPAADLSGVLADTREIGYPSEFE